MWAPNWLWALVDALQATAAGLKNMATAMENLTAAVSAQTTVDASAATLIQGLAQQIKDNATDPAAVQALADQLGAATAPLASAVAANTPAAAPPSAGATGATGAAA